MKTFLITIALFICPLATASDHSLELKEAIDSSNKESIKRILDGHNKDILVDDLPPLHYALKSKNLISADLIISTNYDLSRKDANETLALIYLCNSKDNEKYTIKIFESFMKVSGVLTGKHINNHNYVFNCFGSALVRDRLTSEKYTFNINQKVNDTPLFFYLTMFVDDTEFAKFSYLKPDLSQRDYSGKNLLHFINLQHGFNSKARDHSALIPHLVKNGANINARNDLTYTPLMTALANAMKPTENNYKNIKALVENGAIIRLKSKREEDLYATSLDQAERNIRNIENGNIWGDIELAKKIYRYLLEQNDIQTL